MCKRILLLFVLLSIVGPSIAFAADPNLLAWWKFDEAPGEPNGRYDRTPGAVIDSIGGYNGTAFGDPNSIAGYHGKAIDMWAVEAGGSGGKDDYVEIPTLGTLIQNLESCTLATWINFKPQFVSNWQRISDFGKDTAVYMFWSPSAGTTATSQHRYAITVSSNGAESTVNGNRLTAGWHYVVVTQLKHTTDANNTMRLYVDGVQVGQNLNSRLLPKNLGNTTQNYFGKSMWADDYLNAALDDYMIFNKALDVNEIEAVSDHLEAWPRSPANFMVDANRPQTLKWWPGAYAASTNGHKVYCSPSWADVNALAPSALLATTTDPCYSGVFAQDKTYYWRVLEVNGPSVWPDQNQPNQTITIWSFTIDAPATMPQPPNQYPAVGTMTKEVKWVPHGAATSQTLYFSADWNDVNNSVNPQALGASVNIFNFNTVLGITLQSQTSYYWKVDTTIGALLYKGDIWKFTTMYKMVFNDTFEPGWDAFAGTFPALTGTIWEGVINPGTLYVMNTDINSGKLRIEQQGGFWSGRTGQGTLLYKEVDGPYIAWIEVVSAPGVHNNPRIQNTNYWLGQRVGLMARLQDISWGVYGNESDTGTANGEDWVAVNFYPTYNVGNNIENQGWYFRKTGGAGGTNDNASRRCRTMQESDRMWTGWPDNPANGLVGGSNRSGRWIQIDYKGHTGGQAGYFYGRYSSDGQTWFDIRNIGDEPTPNCDYSTGGWNTARQITNPVNRYGDMNNRPHQVGIRVSQSDTTRYVWALVDNFTLGREIKVKASGPSPASGSTIDGMTVRPQWTPGDIANDQDFYFGTTSAAVTSATRISPEYKGDSLTWPQIYEGLGTPDMNGMYPRYRYIKPTTYAIGATYYWRVDEKDIFSTPEIVWKGDTWSFTIQSYSTVDTFDSYSSTGNLSTAGSIRKTWIDGYIGVGAQGWQQPNPPVPEGSSGSYVQINADPCDGNTTSANPIYQGIRSAKLYYDNDRSIAWLVTLYNWGSSWTYRTEPVPNGVRYSEISAAIHDGGRLTDPTRGLTQAMQNSLGLSGDWRGYSAIRIPYYGNAIGNVADGKYPNTKTANDVLYAVLQDNNDNVARVTCPDTDAVLHQGWRLWIIPMQDFNKNSVNLRYLKRIKIGIGDNSAAGGRGAIFLDEIRLLTGTTVCGPVSPGDPEVTAVQYDWSFNCQTDAEELRMLTRWWLVQATGNPILPDANKLIHLKASSQALGSYVSSWANEGTLVTSFKDPCTTITGRRPRIMTVNGVQAAVFDGNDMLVADVNTPASLTGDRITATPIINQKNPFTIIYKVWNESFTGDEELFVWGKRNTSNKQGAVCFGDGTGWEAAAYWGSGDVVFDNYQPSVGNWHTVFQTYTGGTTGRYYIITDGKLNTNLYKNINIWPDCYMTLGAAYEGNPYLTKREYTAINSGTHVTLALAELKVYNCFTNPMDYAVSQGTPMNLSTGDVPEIIDFKDIGVFALSWMTIDYLTD